MGGFFGITSKKECLMDVFFGTDYHSHLGTKRAGMAAYDAEIGLQREIHNISNSPFRTKFEKVFEDMCGCAAVGSISDSDPQPLLIRSKLGTYAICTIGVINNSDELIDRFFSVSGAHFNAMTSGAVNSTELVAALINQKDNFVDGIRFAQDVIDGTSSILILKEGGELIAARDKAGRLPVLIGKNEDGYAVSFESFAYQKLGYEDEKELGPAEIVSVTPDAILTLSAPQSKKKVCAFLWSYYGYPTAKYEGINVEAMRYRNGEILCENDKAQGVSEEIDYVCGVPDSGTPHAIGYANKSEIPFARPFIKYTPTWPRSFTTAKQADRKKVAKMKLIPVHELIEGKKLLFVDDSIVRGTQLRETVEFLYANGAKEVHMRSACPPIMYSCKYLNFSRSTSDMELIARKTIVELEGEEGLKYISEYSDGNTERGRKLRQRICKKLKFASLEFQSLEGIVKAIGIDRDELCTYCWDGRE
ncbi:MAG: amidophosphoribosyltransferase [Ruminococcaceae bacterium]|nr:amidophosphoribosyltransferase [Oscillospiraceae bacterium]